MAFELDLIVKNLNDLFEINKFPPDQPFSSWLPRVYRSFGIEPAQWIESAFLNSCHGLMIKNCDFVESINTAVFVSDESMFKAVESVNGPQLIFSHHPLDFETSNRGFLPLSEKCLQLLSDQKISIYVVHSPLDFHSDISTGMAWVKNLELINTTKFIEGTAQGFYGIRGEFPNLMNIKELLNKVISISGVTNPNSIIKHENIATVAILAGGPTLEAIIDADELGVDAIITGTYNNQCQNEIGARHREDFNSISNDLSATLIECSHYASEKIVLKHDMLEYFHENFGLPGIFIPQENPWH